MIYSMTGYGKGAANNSKFTVEVEVKSVNNRYIDIYLKLPSLLNYSEYELRELIKKKVKRGKLSVIVSIKENDLEDGIGVPDKEKLKKYIALIKDVRKTAGLKDKIKLEHLLNAQQYYIASGSEIGEEEFNLVKEALNISLDSLLEMKSKEGGELSNDLAGRIKTIEKYLIEIEKESKDNVQNSFDKLKEKIKNLLADFPLNDERIETEAAIIAEKSDITEECVRLKSHLKFFLESLTKEDDPGRKLNFLCQEINREANTISSKSSIITIIHKCVLIKEEIEKIREQIQNIE